MHNGGEKGSLPLLSHRVLSHSSCPFTEVLHKSLHCSFIQSAWLATLLSLTSQRTSHPTCFSKNMALDASAIKSHFENFPTLPYFFGTGCWRNVTGRLPILFTAKLIWFGQHNNAAWNCKLFYSQQIRNKTLPQAGITGKGLPWHQHGSPGKNKSRKVTRSTWIWFSNS